ncbi:LysR family transcriptional regulator [Aliiglaciecola litoralis]|uniref:LysR family transcriptional regulator n=1 Tax=Aliiglaciecola litoralis TaxID=582857 RepID=A0ABN1LNL4_9ALTE
MINPVWLKTFCALADVGHFTRTAEKLFMTQSGVSQHIKKLEQQLNSQLLVREGKSFYLTSKGHQLHQKGQVLLRSIEQLGTIISQDDDHVGLVKIASPGSIGLSLYPHLLDLQQQYQDLSIDYRFAPNHTIEQQLEENQIDLGLITRLSNSNHLLVEKIAQEPLVLVTPSRVKSVNWQTLIELGFIAHPDATHHGGQLLAANFDAFEHIEQFSHKGFSNQISLILAPVAKGLGFTVLPLNAAKAYHPQHAIRIHKLHIPVSENVYVCVNKGSVLLNRVKFMKSEINKHLQNTF